MNKKIFEMLKNNGKLSLKNKYENLLMDFSNSLTEDKYGNTPTIIGSPTLAGGKFVSNGITAIKITSAVANLGTGLWTLEFASKFNNISGASLIHSKSLYGLELDKSGNRLVLYLGSTSTTWDISGSGGITGIKSDWNTTTEYYFRFKFTGTQYIVEWSDDGGVTWTVDITITSSVVVYTGGLGLLFGIYQDEVANPINGTIDNVRITIGRARSGNEPFVTEYNIDALKPKQENVLIQFNDNTLADVYGNTLTLTNNPTITNNKINLSSNKKININTITSFGGGAWTLEAAVKFNRTGATEVLIYPNVYYFAFKKEADNKLTIYLSNTGLSWNIINGLKGTKTDWDTTTEYYFRFKFTGTQYIVEWSSDNGATWTVDITLNSSTPVVSNFGPLTFGCAYDNTLGLDGTMDNIRVTVGRARSGNEPFIAEAA